MPDPRTAPTGSEPPPNTVTYKNPRRTSPQNSITLRHHRLARDASRRHSPTAIPAAPNSASQQQTQAGSLDQQHANSPRRNSSGESNQTGISDPKRWFDLQNENSMRHVDTTAMDIDPPFYQKETDSSNEDLRFPIPTQSPAYRLVAERGPGLSRPGMTQSSSADDYRSVIDDLTVENKRLKEQLKRYRQMGPDSLRRDKLFEVKVHGLPSRKKRELEAALRDFTTSLEGSSTGVSPRKNIKKKNMKTSSEGVSKHASSSSGSQSRPIDSAYASMSTGAVSSDPSLPTSHMGKQQTDRNVEDYLRDIPEGLWPRPTVMTEKEKKRVVVRRLEHLFTGKMGNQTELPSRYVPPPIAEDVEMESTTNTSEGKSSAALPNEAAREATIRLSKDRRKESSRDTGSASNEHSNGDATDSRENGSGSGRGASGGSNTSPQEEVVMQQRPTRPRDLDPDRQQVPAENMDYIRHLGMAAPQGRTHFSARDVSPDADGWVYLNLLCNLAQLHILNVTPDFIRSAVAEMSTKFQMSPDGKKIRWRGGVEGTKFSSDSSGSNSHRSQSGDDTDGSNDQAQRKKQKMAPANNDVMQGQATNFKPQHQDSNSSDDFHYKPLFVHHNTSSSDEQPSVDDAESSSSALEDSNQGLTSRWGHSGGAGGGAGAGAAGAAGPAGAASAGVSQRKRRRDGAIIYYSGANFCTDLSGDFGEVSPDTYDLTSSGDKLEPDSTDVTRPEFSRSSSGSSLPFRPLSNVQPGTLQTDMDLDGGAKPVTQTLTPSTSDDEIDAHFEWSDHKQTATLMNLEASGLAGIYPDDHFVVVVSTRRCSRRQSEASESSDESDSEPPARPRAFTRPSHETSDSRTTTESIAGKLASLTTRSPMPFFVSNVTGSTIRIEYVQGKVRKLPPVALPPPAFYFPNQSSDSDLDDTFAESETESSMSRRVVLADGPASANGDLSGNDEEDEHSEGEEDDYDASGSMSSNRFEDIPPPDIGPQHNPDMPRLAKRTSGSSAATAGGAASGYNSSAEE